MLKKVLIANRGVIACRIIRTLKKMGIASVAVYSEADRYSPHVHAADEAVAIGPAAAAQSYLDADAILAAARATGADGIHPGYGFLSENAAFARACQQSGITWIGPSPEAMELFGPKHTARAIAKKLGVPLLPGTELLHDIEEAAQAAQEIGYPIMLKATAGGGGIGMRVCQDETSLRAAYDAVVALGRNNFKDGGVFAERYVERARHIEVQVFGNRFQEAVAVGERDCSAQRRNQKVLEECPAPNLPSPIRAAMHQAAVQLALGVGYRSAGTVEFLYDDVRQEFYFLEVNTRLQVEHGVTEEVYGIDLVEWMVRESTDDLTQLASLLKAPNGHSLQARIYAEDPARNFIPSAGLLDMAEFPAHARIETWVATGTNVSSYYDPMLAKIIVHGNDRSEALRKLADALEQTRLYGIECNVAWLSHVIAQEVFAQGKTWTRWLETLAWQPRGLEILDGGTFTTVQDYPGRLGHWDVGVPPCGPMDNLSLQNGNRILGNAPGAAGLEMTLRGITAKFRSAIRFCLTGAPMQAELDGKPIPFHTPIEASAGSLLRLGNLTGGGMRTYLLVEGGFDVAPYLDSASTFTLGQFGGHGGRTLRVGDVLHIGAPLPHNAETTQPSIAPIEGHHWEIGALSGPHSTAEYIVSGWMQEFFAARWEVHYQSARTGVRLVGPRPRWARTDGGEAGLHPSNLHDNAYAIGSVDFTGDMPVILGPDGPSLGGFVCPATVIQSELWKLGQLRPGDTVTFVPVDGNADSDPILARIVDGVPFPVTIRRAGDAYVLVEYGPMELDLRLRFRAHALMSAVQQRTDLPIIDLTPGIRSLQVHFDPARMNAAQMAEILTGLEKALPTLDQIKVPSRIVHLPLSWDDPATREAIDRYQKNVRPDAPWCPSNIEFIRRINGLDSIDDVQRIVFDASYLVLGLGDVYLGAPVAVPLDPRHRLVTTKYNPARTWTPENAVGIGGAYMCIYGMEGPGGYQFVGRTLQVWNRHRSTEAFKPGKPWLLRFFDQIRFFPVSAEELLRQREDFAQGRYGIRIEEVEFDLGDYERWLADIAPQTETFKSVQRQSFQEERDNWKRLGLAEYVAETTQDSPLKEEEAPAGCQLVCSPIPGSVWKTPAAVGTPVRKGDVLVIAESMKMEMPIESPCDGVLQELRIKAGDQIRSGQILAVIREGGNNG